MHPRQKRYRQTNIFECFERKKTKPDNTEMNSKIREKTLAAAEKRVLSSSSAGNENHSAVKSSEIRNSDNVNSEACCSKAESFSKKNDTILQSNIVDNSCVNSKASTSKSNPKVKTNGNIDAKASLKIETKTENSDTMYDCKIEAANSDEMNASCNKIDYESSPDLFPDKPSSPEDCYLPSSAELFSDEKDSETQLSSAVDRKGDDSEEEEDVSFLNRSPDCCIPLPKLEPLENHSIMFSPYVRPGDAPRPYPSSYRDRWDSDHVRMPCSPMNRFPVEDRNGEKHIESRWNLICESLSTEIRTSDELEAAILRYNSHYAGRMNFQGLHAFINVHITEAEQEHFFETMLPAMIKIALDLPKICTQPIPLLKKGKDHYLTMSQKQIGCLLLNAFFCTFPRRILPNKRHRQTLTCEYASFPDINFNRLFYGVKYRLPDRNAEKLKCLFNYFRRITSEEPSGTVTFHRQCIPSEDLPKWNESTKGIKTAVIKSSGVIETEGHGMLQVDFANKFIGGGVLGQGCVQEEIRFIICPELIVSRLFVECLSHNEVLIVKGVEQYNKYSGYADSFRFEGDFKDMTPRDSWGRCCTQLVAMDATSFHSHSTQFKPYFLTRELNKAFCGFYENASPNNLPAVATGNWGCGVFGGNANLKFLIQLMAASEAGRSLLYFTFGNKELKTELQNMYKFLIHHNLGVGDVWRLLIKYAENVSAINKEKCSKLHDFLFSHYLTKEENCRQQENEIEETPPLDDSDSRAVEKLVEDAAWDSSSTETEDVIHS